MSVGTIILIILVIALLGGFSGIGGGPFYGTGYYGGGGLGLCDRNPADPPSAWKTVNRFGTTSFTTSEAKALLSTIDVACQRNRF